MEDNLVVDIPKKLIICGVDVDIFYPRELHGDYIGLFDSKTPSIKISPKSKNYKPILSCFLHEVLHAVDFFYLDGALKDATDEIGIKLLECTLFDIILRNKNKLFINNLPKTIDILGYTLSIERSDFEDSAYELNFNVCMYEEVITINEDVENNKLISQILICAILSGLFTRLNLDFDISKVITFGRGLYQVFVDNNLIQLFKEVV